MMSVIRLSAVMLSAVMLSVMALIVRASYKLFDRSFDLTPSCPNFLFFFPFKKKQFFSNHWCLSKPEVTQYI
jgi:hypothetical protein